MRTTVTLDDDVADKLHDRMRQSGGSLKDTLNDCLRRGLEQPAMTSSMPTSSSTPTMLIAARLGARCRPSPTTDRDFRRFDGIRSTNPLDTGESA